LSSITKYISFGAQKTVFIHILWNAEKAFIFETFYCQINYSHFLTVLEKSVLQSKLILSKDKQKKKYFDGCTSAANEMVLMHYWQ